MRHLFLYKITALFLMVFLTFSCSDETDGYEYKQVKLTDDDGTVSYTAVESYPVVGTIVSEAPQFEVTGVYRFSKGDIVAPVGSAFTASKFVIDIETGVIEYNNTGDLSPGDYFVSVKLENSNGLAVYNRAYNLNIKQVPVSLQADNSDVSVGFFDTGVLATLSFTDISAEGDIESVTYSIVNPPAGFSINATTGEISKTVNAVSGVNTISVVATTNLGAALFPSFVTVTVGAPPTISYKQQDGVTNLNKVILSPWTGYTTSTPVLEGMNSVGYTVDLPNTLTPGSVTVNATGNISIAPDQNLPTGTYALGVKVTNSSGIEVTFNNVFELMVESRWDTTDLFNDTFNDGGNHTTTLLPGNSAYPEYTGYTIGAAETAWQKIILTAAGKEDVEAVRVFNPGNDDHYLVRTIDITGVKAMKVSFSELFGYNDEFITKYQRGLYAGESTSDLDAGTFNASNWNVLIANDDERWLRGSLWNATRSMTPVNDILVDLSAISGNTLKLAWYIGLLTTSQNGQYFLDNINAQVATAFVAEEE